MASVRRGPRGRLLGSAMGKKLLGYVLGLSAATFALACGIGDWGKTGQIIVISTCEVTVYSFTCGGPLGNQIQVTGIVGAFETGACPLV